MTNDTTRMEKLADDLSAVTIPSCKHMDREEYRDCVLQMLDDLEQLGRRDGCIAAAWALDALPSLQRELAEARRELFLAREGCQLAIDNMHCEDEQDIAMTSHTLQEILNGAPAPSDVKGEEPSVSDTKLTPLTDPSVRGVLVDAGEPRQILGGELFMWHSQIDKKPLGQWKSAEPSESQYQPVTLRPASEFGFEDRHLAALQNETGKVWHYQQDAERLRKAIENGIECIKRQGNPVAFSWISECLYGLQAALSPSPAAASGGWLNKMADAEDAAGDISIGTSAPAAESEGGESYEQFIDRASLTRDDLFKMLAACEEMCWELEAGIERHRRDAGTAMPFFTNDMELWSLLAPKAGGESQTPPNKPEYTTCGRCGERYVGRMCPAGC